MSVEPSNLQPSTFNLQPLFASRGQQKPHPFMIDGCCSHTPHRRRAKSFLLCGFRCDCFSSRKQSKRHFPLKNSLAELQCLAFIPPSKIMFRNTDVSLQ